jgi:hypothetical protein
MRWTITPARARASLAALTLLAAGSGTSLPWAAPAHAQSQPAPSATPAYVTRQSDVEIPFSVKQGTTPENQPASVRVFVSWDQGKSWHFLDERRPADGRFRFQPKQDGEYWFSTQTVDRSGRSDTSQPRRAQLRLVIDTQKPQLLAQATVGPYSDVTLAFSASDPTLQPATLKIEYQDASGIGPWQAVELSPQATSASAGQTTGKLLFRPEVKSRAINLRAEVADAAGNVAYFTQRLSLVPPKPRTAAAASGPAADPSATRWPANNPFVPTGELAADETGAEEIPADSRPREIHNLSGGMPNVVQNPYAQSAGAEEAATPAHSPYAADGSLIARSVAQSQGGHGELTPPTEELPPPGGAAPGNDSSAAERQTLLPQPGDTAGYGPVDAGYTPTEATTRDGYSNSPSSEPLPPPRRGSAPEPAPTYGSEPAYGAEPSYGPEPTGTGMTYGTGSSYNNGSSYAGGSSYGGDPRPSQSYESLPAETSPATSRPTPNVESLDPTTGQRPRLTNQRRFSLDYDVEAVGPEGLSDVELWGTSDGGHSWMKWGSDPDRKSPFDVEVNGEASYGFRVVIVGKSGLASNAPRPGDTADIWVGIDLTRPVAKLTSAAYGQDAAAGKLDIRWEASDANLAPRPITLLMSDRPDGVFTPIAAGLPNSGQYFWEFDPRSPRQIYLRLEVRDEAGNTAVDQLTEPILVEGLQPKGRIRGFNVGGN